MRRARSTDLPTSLLAIEAVVIVVVLFLIWQGLCLRKDYGMITGTRGQTVIVKTKDGNIWEFEQKGWNDYHVGDFVEVTFNTYCTDDRTDDTIEKVKKI